MIKSFILMLGFFTRIPVRCEYSEKRFERGIILYPLIGVVIGGLIYLPSLLPSEVSKTIIVILSWVLYMWITGSLHIDGLADTFDGFYSNRNKERILEIMKDSRIGTFGVIGIIVVILINIFTLIEINFIYLFLFPIVGKCSVLISCSISDYARKEPGMGVIFVEKSGALHSIFSVVFCLVIGYIFGGFVSVIACLITFLIVLLLTGWIKKIIIGMTGDTCGFINEISQSIFLLSGYFIGLLL